MPTQRKSRKTRNATLAVYLPRHMLEELRDMAEKDHRSASTQALILIERGLKAANEK